MESQPQNPEFRINPENFHPCYLCFQEIRFPLAYKPLYDGHYLNYKEFKS